MTQKSLLSSDTKAKLEALGITATDGMTESEAQSKIEAVEAQEESNSGEQQENPSESENL